MSFFDKLLNVRNIKMILETKCLIGYILSDLKSLESFLDLELEDVNFAKLVVCSSELEPWNKFGSFK
jgi:hypothetical protein